jgi:hypothetical protein
MQLSSFLAEFRKTNGVFLTPSVILFRKPLEVYDLSSDKVIAKGNKKNKWDDSILDAVVAGRTVGDIIASLRSIPIIVLRGGRGSGSDSFSGSWDFSGNSTKDNSTNDYPARLNRRTKSEADTLSRFRDLHANDNMQEHAITVDDRGFVTQYVHGNGGSVGIAAKNGETVYHNHPAAGWPNFSKDDIYNASLTNSKGVVASSSREGRSEKTINYAGDYTFTKNQNFNANGFLKELNKAQLKGKDYNDAVSKWLGNKSRQRKYGYKYSFTPAKA